MSNIILDIPKLRDFYYIWNFPFFLLLSPLNIISKTDSEIPCVTDRELNEIGNSALSSYLNVKGSH